VFGQWFKKVSLPTNEHDNGCNVPTVLVMRFFAIVSIWPVKVWGKEGFNG
jgi:hypothetical protein